MVRVSFLFMHALLYIFIINLFKYISYWKAFKTSINKTRGKYLSLLRHPFIRNKSALKLYHHLLSKCSIKFSAHNRKLIGRTLNYESRRTARCQVIFGTRTYTWLFSKVWYYIRKMNFISANIVVCKHWIDNMIKVIFLQRGSLVYVASKYICV